MLISSKNNTICQDLIFSKQIPSQKRCQVRDSTAGELPKIIIVATKSLKWKKVAELLMTSLTVITVTYFMGQSKPGRLPFLRIMHFILAVIFLP
jgi:hypothetical protein